MGAAGLALSFHEVEGEERRGEEKRGCGVAVARVGRAIVRDA